MAGAHTVEIRVVQSSLFITMYSVCLIPIGHGHGSLNLIQYLLNLVNSFLSDHSDSLVSMHLVR